MDERPQEERCVNLVLQESPLIEGGQRIDNGIVHPQLPHVVVDVKLIFQLPNTLIHNSSEFCLSASDTLDSWLKHEQEFITAPICDSYSIFNDFFGLLK